MGILLAYDFNPSMDIFSIIGDIDLPPKTTLSLWIMVWPGLLLGYIHSFRYIEKYGQHSDVYFLVGTGMCVGSFIGRLYNLVMSVKQGPRQVLPSRA